MLYSTLWLTTSILIESSYNIKYVSKETKYVIRSLFVDNGVNDDIRLYEPIDENIEREKRNLMDSACIISFYVFDKIYNIYIPSHDDFIRK